MPFRAGPQIIDFETVAPGVYSSLHFMLGSTEVAFSRPSSATFRVSELSLAPYRAGSFGGRAIDSAFTFPIFGILATFSTTVQAVSIDFLDYSGPRQSRSLEDDTAYLFACGAAGNLLASASFFLPGDVGILSSEYGRIYIAAAGIASIRFTSTNFGSQPSDSVYWDNIRINGAALPAGIYSFTAIPEPSTYAESAA